jgi:hypothetical protein
LQLTAGSDGRVQRVSLTFQQQDSGSAAGDGAYPWSVNYSPLGTTSLINAPRHFDSGHAVGRPFLSCRPQLARAAQPSKRLSWTVTVVM